MRHGEFKGTTAHAQRRIARILEVLKDGPITARELADSIHCSHSLATLYLRKLMEKPRRVRIADHDIVCARVVPMYGLGDTPDRKYVAMTPGEHWFRLQQERPERYLATLEKKRQWYRDMRAKLPPEQVKKRRKVFARPLDDLIIESLERRAGRTVEQIAGELNASKRTVERKILVMRGEGLIRRVAGPFHSREPWRWEVPDNPAPTVIRRPVPKQSIFSALGL